MEKHGDPAEASSNEPHSDKPLTSTTVEVATDPNISSATNEEETKDTSKENPA